MFDCGMHMGYNDERRFPDFSVISKTGDFTQKIDAVIISHFHLDHCGALAYFSEMCGYDGPIYMTAPTKAIVPILLEDYRKIMVDRKGEQNFFTSAHIKACMEKVIVIGLHESIQIDNNLTICAYYAGHVLGAAMIHAVSGNESVLYTGDYNMTPDRHLGSAWVDRIKPTVLITESTYGTTIRDSKRARERDFLEKVYRCVSGGGKVLIPCFALGRAQELCILIESYWERMGLKVPVYFSAGLTERANMFYKLFISWTNQKVKSVFTNRNPFDFKYIKPWKHEYADLPGPMVTFATPGMLHIGMSLEIFKKWAPDPKNMLIIPGYCVSGTVGAKVLAGATVVDIDQYTKVKVNLKVENLSFSAHADAKGIMELVRQAQPSNVVLVHGEKSRMTFLKSKIMSEFGIPCFDPENGEILPIIESKQVDQGLVSNRLLESSWMFHTIDEYNKSQKDISEHTSNNKDRWELKKPIKVIPIDGVLVRKNNESKIRLVRVEDVLESIEDRKAFQNKSGSNTLTPITKTPLYRFTTYKPFNGNVFDSCPIAKKYNLSSEMAAILAVSQNLKCGFGIEGKLELFANPSSLDILFIKNNNRNDNIDVLPHSDKNQEPKTFIEESVDSDKNPNKRLKLDFSNEPQETKEENGFVTNRNDTVSGANNSDVLGDKDDGDNLHPEIAFCNDYEIFLSNEKSNFAASLSWCGVTVGIPTLENRRDMEDLDLLQISWSIDKEMHASIVFSEINKVLIF
ncbi:hypothetical protein BB559_003463 [Furculomyces boomerangus]|uniref:Metallo-beta-lactamase domain-containing protein n=2 Tax=Harpellales TaxID=61421 RepID=A0A2T9YL50_9FUNG|nr:hypothetical protein BB559_003463 [Furculomyces boomerangus]PWA01441.1 hypothetical protein BB558_002454 [Smittium angustum]